MIWRNKQGRLILTIFFVLFMSGCSIESGSVNLCDYKHIPILEETLQITEDDVNAAVRNDLLAFFVQIPKLCNATLVEDGDAIRISVSFKGGETQEYDLIAGTPAFGDGFADCVLGKSIGEPFSFPIGEETVNAVVLSISEIAQEMTDEIAEEYYGCASKEDALQLVRKAIAKRRIFDVVYPEIVNNSMIRGFEKEREAYAIRAANILAREAEQEGHLLEEYLDEMGMTLAEYQQSMASFYDTYLIMEKLMEEENVRVTEEEFSDFCIRELGDAYDESIPDEELFGPMGKEYVLYSLWYFERCSEVLTPYYLSLFQQ